MPSKLIERTSSALERRVGRRGFLVRGATAAAALATVPRYFALRPGTAYAAICSCSGSSCTCGSLCCDGYTEFCCTLNGVNACPPGALTAGWWKADGSGFCDINGAPKPRYYMDCNAKCGSCSCGGSGVCAGSCSGTPCGCANGSCGNRKAGCTKFRYGQCNQNIACVGPIICRVVTCTPPWQLDPHCTTTVLTDNNTRFHDRPCLHGRPSSVAVRNGSTWYLRDTSSAGAADRVFTFGAATDIPVFGDWNGDGVKTPGVVHGNQWYLRNSNTSGPADITFSFGAPGDIPIVGDWTGGGKDLPGVVRGGRTWYLRNSLTSGPATTTFAFGKAGDVPVVGDWNGDGRDTPGVVRGGRYWYLRNTATAGNADITLTFGQAGDIPVVGDWDGNGKDSIGVVRKGTWYLRNAVTSGNADRTFVYSSTSSPTTTTTSTTSTTAPPAPASPDVPLVWRL